MGPAGLLCVQRTLNKGPWHGFFSGIGVACSDIIYASIICLGMGFVIDLVYGHQNILLVVGSILLMGYGIYIFRKPMVRTKKTKEKNNSYYQDTVSTFFLAVSNPFIIVPLIPIFSSYNFIIPENKFFSMMLGLLSVLAGAILWWILIAFLTGKLRKIINIRGLWIMNKIVGTIIILLAIAAIFSIWGK
jgi:threonine/homoserine/homoserine lactone efflux protein